MNYGRVGRKVFGSSDDAVINTHSKAEAHGFVLTGHFGTAGPVQAGPVQADRGHSELVQARADNADQNHPSNRPLAPQPVLKGITAADVAAEIAHLDPTAVAAAPVTPDGKPESTPVPALSASATALSPVPPAAAAFLAPPPFRHGQTAR